MVHPRGGLAAIVMIAGAASVIIVMGLCQLVGWPNYFDLGGAWRRPAARWPGPEPEPAVLDLILSTPPTSSEVTTAPVAGCLIRLSATGTSPLRASTGPVAEYFLCLVLYDLPALRACRTHVWVPIVHNRGLDMMLSDSSYSSWH